MHDMVGRLKNIAVLVVSGLSAWMGILFLPMVLLVAANVIDYVTGLVAAPRRGQQRSSDRGFTGIAKKVCMWLLVLVGVMVDALIGYAVQTLGWENPLSYFVAVLVCIWLLANELLSILENISDIGVAVPPFLKPLIEWVKKRVNPTPKPGRTPHPNRNEKTKCKQAGQMSGLFAVSQGIMRGEKRLEQRHRTKGVGCPPFAGLWQGALPCHALLRKGIAIVVPYTALTWGKVDYHRTNV